MTRRQKSGLSSNFGGYRFGFNGKEKDTKGEWGTQTHYDYGFRIYNPAIARFLSVDPLSPDYPWYTPYQFAGNKPIYAIDLDGLEEYPAHIQELIDNHDPALGNVIVLSPYSGEQVNPAGTTPPPVCCDVTYRTEERYDATYQPEGLDAPPPPIPIYTDPLAQQEARIDDFYTPALDRWTLNQAQINHKKSNVELAAAMGPLPFPVGFASFGAFRQFETQIQAGLARLGYKNTKLYLQGSAATGTNLAGEAFDVARKSDFDVALVGDDIFNAAKEAGLVNGTRTGPISVGGEEAAQLGIGDLLERLSTKSGRDVNVMIFETVEAVKEKGASIRIPTAADGF